MFRCDIRWIKGHSGNREQELVDSLGKEAARENNQTRVTDVTLKDVKHYVQRQPKIGRQGARTTRELQKIYSGANGDAIGGSFI